jgi:putative DNA primase/helicase
VPWPAGAARNAAAWALERWIELRGGTEPAEARQAIEAVRLFIEQHGDARFASVDDADARPVANRAGYRKGSGAEREWWVLPEVWRTEICAGQDSKLVARVLADLGMLRTQETKLQSVVRLSSKMTVRAYVVTATIMAGAGGDEG